MGEVGEAIFPIIFSTKKVCLQVVTFDIMFLCTWFLKTCISLHKTLNANSNFPEDLCSGQNHLEVITGRNADVETSNYLK